MSGTFSRAPVGVRCYVTLTVTAALVLPFALSGLGLAAPAHGHALTTLAALLAISVVNVELGRLMEGGMSISHRPHKALSAWAFCCALLLPLPFLLPVVALSYAHARWRGIRIPLWKWVGSASFVALSAVGAGPVALAVNGGDPSWMAGTGGRGLLAMAAGALVYLALETAFFHGIAYLNVRDDELWLRRTLAGRSYYLTESAVLLIGALTAAVWEAGAWFLVLLVPVYGLMQRAALAEPLRERAETDDKTGLLRFESWRALAVTERQRCQDKGRPWSLLFVDLDHFKAFNDTYGHLAGDAALVAVAGALGQQLRATDLVSRFGGEEFCVFLPDTPAEKAAEVAERLRAAVADCQLADPRARVTISVGAVSAPRDQPGPGTEFIQALTAADRALMTAKLSGRNRVSSHELDSDVPDLEPARNG